MERRDPDVHARHIIAFRRRQIGGLEHIISEARTCPSAREAAIKKLAWCRAEIRRLAG